MDVIDFFELSTGKWRSQRTTHHLAFKQFETGESEIQVDVLAAGDPQVIATCQLHQVDPEQTIGGALVSWEGGMGWDKANESHEGTTIFALVPDPEHPDQGTLLRDRGYAEVAPVAGHYRMAAGSELVLITEYDIMRSVERFWFASPNLRLRTSTVQLHGGFTTATFCTELRVLDAVAASIPSDEVYVSSQD